MGLRRWARSNSRGVGPANARLGEDEASDNDYSEALALGLVGLGAPAVWYLLIAVLRDYAVPVAETTLFSAS